MLRTGVECPSLSPDGTRIAFKKRNPGTVVTWGISVLDLATLEDHPLAETRNVDDQVEWLDDQTVIYGLPQDAGEVNAVAEVSPGTPVLGGQASIETQHLGGTRRRSWDSEGADHGRVVHHPRPRLIGGR